MAFALPDGLFYIDAASAKTYDDNAGKEVVFKQHVNASVGATFDAWIKQLWFVDKTEEVVAGSGRGHVGSERLVTKPGIKERIEAAGAPSDNDAPGAVATILFKMTDFGSAPVEDHIAIVRFLPVANGTEIVWSMKMTLAADAPPRPEGSPDPKVMTEQALASLAKSFE